MILLSAHEMPKLIFSQNQERYHYVHYSDEAWGVQTKQNSYQSTQLQRLARKLEFWL